MTAVAEELLPLVGTPSGFSDKSEDCVVDCGNRFCSCTWVEGRDSGVLLVVVKGITTGTTGTFCLSTGAWEVGTSVLVGRAGVGDTVIVSHCVVPWSGIGREIRPSILPIRIAGKPAKDTNLRKKIRSLRSHARR